MSTSEQEKLSALLARAVYASGTPFCMVENSHWQASFNSILQVLKIDANSEALCRFDTVKFKRL